VHVLVLLPSLHTMLNSTARPFMQLKFVVHSPKRVPAEVQQKQALLR
jgi:hypothetical protein